MLQQNQGCLGFLFGLFGGAKEEPSWGKLRLDEKEQRLPYRTTDSFLSRAELSFYGVLRLAVGDSMVICPKVSLKDIFYVTSRENQQTWRNKIDRKHVDFLLCDPPTLRPLLGIELDDVSHQREKTQVRDAFVETVFESADLPFLRMPVRASYTVDQVTGLLKEALATRSELKPPAAGENASAQPVRRGSAVVPICPKCHIPLVLRESKKGGSRFWGCSNYPRCHQTAPLDA